MELTYEVLEAFCNDVRWHDELADYLGSEWDSDGSMIYNLIWEKIHDTWGEHGAEFISDYITGKQPFIYNSDGEYLYATNLKSLIKILNEFFLIKEEKEES